MVGARSAPQHLVARSINQANAILERRFLGAIPAAFDPLGWDRLRGASYGVRARVRALLVNFGTIPSNKN